MASDSTSALREASVAGVHATHAPAAQQPPGHETAVHWQAPPTHSKLSPHALWSATFGVEQAPLVASHVPTVWHAVGVGHIFAAPAVQTPALHTSAVQASSSAFEHALSSALLS